MSEEQQRHLLSFPGPLLVQGAEMANLHYAQVPSGEPGPSVGDGAGLLPSPTQELVDQSIYSSPLLPEMKSAPRPSAVSPENQSLLLLVTSYLIFK